MQVSVLILEEMGRSLEAMGAMVPDATATGSAVREYAESIAAAWRLLAQAGATTMCDLGDWRTGNLMVTWGDVRLVNWAGTFASEKTSYQRLKRAKETLLRDMSCARHAHAAGAVWFDALDALTNICHAWWPPGRFNNADGIPTVDDVECLRRDFSSYVSATFGPL